MYELDKNWDTISLKAKHALEGNFFPLASKEACLQVPAGKEYCVKSVSSSQSTNKNMDL